jgi:sialate O-acetylesterase
MKRLVWLGLFWLGSSTLFAGIQLAPLFQNNAVLQQGKPVPVWGLAAPGETLAITYTAPVAADSQELTTVADANGRWQATLAALHACAEPATLTVSGTGEKLVRTGILVGEVWLAAGQSNMDMALFWTKRGKEVAKTADLPLIRYFKIGTVAKDSPQFGLHGNWNACRPGGAGGFSELGFYFARELHRELGVPIGIINSSWGGTAIEAWMDAKTLANDPAGAAVRERWEKALGEFPAKQEKYRQAKAAWQAEKDTAGPEFKKQAPFPPGGGPGSQYMPSGLYNAMLHPLIPGAIRGVIWYQGENNAAHPAEYRTLFPSFITGMRTLLKQGDIPFYWVQLPNYNIGDNAADWAGLREAQSAALALPGTGQAVTIDIGDPKEIHPANKEEVARRLALLAFKRTYGKAATVDSGPVLARADFLADNTVQVRFKECAGGLKSTAGNVQGFELAGDDGIFHTATARITVGDSVLVNSEKISKPTAIRYAWHNNPTGLTLANSNGLPAAPFWAKRDPEPPGNLPPARENKHPQMGVCVHFSNGWYTEPEIPRKIAEAGFSWVREDFYWAQMEKEKGSYTLPPGYRKTIDALHAAGLNILAIFNGGNKLYGNPFDKEAFAKAAAWFAKETEGKVQAIEILNEPHNFGFRAHYGGTWNGMEKDGTASPWVGEYVRLLNTAAPAIRQANPKVRIIGLGGVPPVNFRQLEMGIATSVDGIADHPYSPRLSAEYIPYADNENILKRDGIITADERGTFASQVKMCRERSVKFHGPRQIWHTEFGWPSYQENKNGNLFAGFTRDAQAKYLLRRMAESLGLGIEMLFIYNLRDNGPDKHNAEHNFGLLDIKMRPKPAYEAVKRFNTFMAKYRLAAKPTARITPITKHADRQPVVWDGSKIQTDGRIACHQFADNRGNPAILLWSIERAGGDLQPAMADIELPVQEAFTAIFAYNILTGELSKLPFEQKGQIISLKKVTIPDTPMALFLE